MKRFGFNRAAQSKMVFAFLGEWQGNGTGAVRGTTGVGVILESLLPCKENSLWEKGRVIRYSKMRHARKGKIGGVEVVTFYEKAYFQMS